MSKSILQIIQSCSVQKTARKSTKYSRNETILKFVFKAITFAKSSLCIQGQKIKSQEHVKIHATNHLELFCAKNRSQKHQIFEKLDHFENWPSCKGYSLCKILSLNQELKFRKACQNPFYQSFKLFCSKNRSKKH